MAHVLFVKSIDMSINWNHVHWEQFNFILCGSLTHIAQEVSIAPEFPEAASNYQPSMHVADFQMPIFKEIKFQSQLFSQLVRRIHVTRDCVLCPLAAYGQFCTTAFIYLNLQALFCNHLIWSASTRTYFDYESSLGKLQGWYLVEGYGWLWAKTTACSLPMVLCQQTNARYFVSTGLFWNPSFILASYVSECSSRNVCGTCKDRACIMCLSCRSLLRKYQHTVPLQALDY